jgi:hypothetical protein
MWANARARFYRVSPVPDVSDGRVESRDSANLAWASLEDANLFRWPPLELGGCIAPAPAPASVRMRRPEIALFTLLAALGCRGVVPDSLADSGELADGSPGSDASRTIDSSSPSDAGAADEAHSPVCPESVPALGSPCSPALDPRGAQFACEYGDASWNVSCDTVVECSDTGWIPVSPGGQPCTPQPNSLSPECPTSATLYSQTPSICAEAGVTCDYPQGGTCQCLGDPYDAAVLPLKWDCVPGSECPAARPRLGSACSGELGCTYENCVYSEVCGGGVWLVQPYLCL